MIAVHGRAGAANRKWHIELPMTGSGTLVEASLRTLMISLCNPSCSYPSYMRCGFVLHNPAAQELMVAKASAMRGGALGRAYIRCM